MVYNQYNDFSFHLILKEQLNMMQVLHLFHRYIMISSQILNDVDHVDDLPYKTKIIKNKINFFNNQQTRIKCPVIISILTLVTGSSVHDDVEFRDDEL